MNLVRTTTGGWVNLDHVVSIGPDKAGEALAITADGVEHPVRLAEVEAVRQMAIAVPNADPTLSAVTVYVSAAADSAPFVSKRPIAAWTGSPYSDDTIPVIAGDPRRDREEFSAVVADDAYEITLVCDGEGRYWQPAGDGIEFHSWEAVLDYARSRAKGARDCKIAAGGSAK